MNRRALASALLLVSLAAFATARPRGSEPVDQLRQRLLGRTPLAEDLRILVGEIGGRPTGSGAMEQAVDWAVERLRAAGLDEVRTEPFTVARAWLPGEESAAVLVEQGESVRRERLRVAAMPYSASTAAEGLAAPVADVGAGDEEGFEEAGSVRGKLVLVRTGTLPERERPKSLVLAAASGIAGHAQEAAVAADVFARARARGAAGVLWASNRPERALYRQNVAIDGRLSPLPGVVVEHEPAERLARRLARGEAVRVSLSVDAAVEERLETANVVAEIEGGELPEETVVLGAHLDSWDLGQGALDNGCNVALVLDVARQAAALARLGHRPRRTLRFVLFGAEELGLLGSRADVWRNREALDRLRAVVIFDYGTSRATGFSLGGRPEVEEAVEQALAPVEDLGPFRHTTGAFVGTDNYDYLVEGVPTLVANQDLASYVHDYHAESDTLDKVETEEVKANAAIAAVLVWNLADAEGLPLGRRLSRTQVESLVRRTDLEKQMRSFGLWADFISGVRGRQVR